MIYLKLFFTFVLLGAFSFGGGLGSMELIRSRVVDQQMWLTNSEFTDIISISEMTPGPLGINIASFVGIRVAGIPGTILSTFGYVLPAFLIVLLIARLYYKYRSLSIMQGILRGLRPAVAAMIIYSTLKIAGNAYWGGMQNFSLPDTNLIAVLLTAAMLYLLEKKKLSPVQTILVSGAVGAVLYAIAV